MTGAPTIISFVIQFTSAVSEGAEPFRVIVSGRGPQAPGFTVATRSTAGANAVKRSCRRTPTLSRQASERAGRSPRRWSAS